MEKEVTTNEILEAINIFATQVDRRFDLLGADVEGLKSDVAILKTDVSILKTDVSMLKTDVSLLKTDVSILKTDVSMLKMDVSLLKTDVEALKEDSRTFKNQMVTKDYLDDKLASQKAELVQLLGMENSKFNALVRTLQKNRGITEIEAIKLLAMKPFPQTV